MISMLKILSPLSLSPTRINNSVLNLATISCDRVQTFNVFYLKGPLGFAASLVEEPFGAIRQNWLFTL